MRTVLGYHIRVVGDSPEAAPFGGIHVNTVLITTALLSGGLAGLAGVGEVGGVKGNLTLDLSPGYGYSGIVVAMLALLNPIGVVPSAIFVAGVFVRRRGDDRATGVPGYLAMSCRALPCSPWWWRILFTRVRRGGTDESLRHPSRPLVLSPRSAFAADLRDHG